jgi:hypothetical protein
LAVLRPAGDGCTPMPVRAGRAALMPAVEEELKPAQTEPAKRKAVLVPAVVGGSPRSMRTRCAALTPLYGPVRTGRFAVEVINLSVALAGLGPSVAFCACD